jgi:hypothetical protein
MNQWPVETPDALQFIGEGQVVGLAGEDDVPAQGDVRHRPLAR